MNTYYQILGVQPTATMQQVKAAYLRMARIYHPDKTKQPIQGPLTFVVVRQAYQAICKQNTYKTAQATSMEQAERLRSKLANLIDSLYSSDSEEEEDIIDDDYFSRRMKTMDEQYQQIKKLLHRNDEMQIQTPDTDTDSHSSGGSVKLSGVSILGGGSNLIGSSNYIKIVRR